ncbi:MAG: YkvA family protein [Mycobacteriales bacterium]
MWWQAVVGVLAGLLLLYAVFLGALWFVARRGPHLVSSREALRIVPDVVRLVRRLAADPTVPRGVRVRLVLLLIYLVSPLDLVPDVVPVVGYADDAILVALTLRSVIRRAGPEALERHWPGTDDGLAVVRRLAAGRAGR